MRVCVIGSGTRFLSGISYYTWRLTTALSERTPTSVILMRRLVPRRLYPGRQRVGEELAAFSYGESVPVFDGVDWYWLPSMLRAIRFVVRERPDVIVFQWWTGSVLHSYLLLAAVARLRRARIIVEFHEVLDTGEAQLPLVGSYVRALGRVLMRLASAFVVHSEFDRPALEQTYAIGDRPVAVIPHGPFDHHGGGHVEPLREAPPDVCNVLFFGTIRPYKGLEDLVAAFNALPADEARRYWLTVVGETWEGWTQPAELIARSPYRDRITFVNRYVTDAEVDGWYTGADVVALPYRRSSASGPLHVTMSQGLPVIVTAVGGLQEAAAEYEGAVFVPPAEPAALARALREAAALRGRRYADPHSWARSSERLLELATAP